MADDWLGISSAELIDFCGEHGYYTIAKGLDGTNIWYHMIEETHYFVLDLGDTYTITKVRGRSDETWYDYDPTDINIYIDDNNPPTTLCKEGISTWINTVNLVEIVLTTSGTGRYVKVEIENTEHINNLLGFGSTDTPFTIFDAYGDIYTPPPPPPATGMTGVIQNSMSFD